MTHHKPEHHISAQIFAERYKSGQLFIGDVEIVDVREPEEWEMVHLEKSKLIPLGDIPRRMGEIDRKAAVYVLCAHGIRSLHAAHFLRQQGFECVINVDGGIAEVCLHLEERDGK